MKLPAFQFYPGDWLKDTGALSLAAKGAWIESLVRLWDAQIRGVLTHKPIGWARIWGCTSDQAVQVLSELRESRVCEVENQDDSWTMGSRRFIREECMRRRDRDRKGRGISEENYRKSVSELLPTYFRALSESYPPSTEDEDEEEGIGRKGGGGEGKRTAWDIQQRITAIDGELRTMREDGTGKYVANGVMKPEWKKYADELVEKKRALKADLTGVKKPT